MATSITRKFLVRDLPDLSGKTKETYLRYYLYNQNQIVIRVQQINDEYELERKANESDLVRKGETIKITKDEFEVFRQFASQSIQRDSYQIQANPKIFLRVYQGEYEGLNRAEVNFASEAEAQSFQPLNWFEREITGTALAQDGDLLQLNKEAFTKLLA